MKKLLLFITTILIAVATLSVTISCSKADQLKGTTWIGTHDGITETLTFTTNSTFTVSASFRGQTESYSGTFVVSDKTIILTTDGETLQGTIVDGKTMIIEGVTFKKS